MLGIVFSLLAPFNGIENVTAGKPSFTWFGPTPRVMISDPESIREVMSNKFGHYGKPKATRLGKLLASGVVSYEGEKWAKHRRILNPAFHHEKIKVKFILSLLDCSIPYFLLGNVPKLANNVVSFTADAASFF